MSLSAAQAAGAVGMTKQGLIKALKSGKVSATKDVHGEWQIEPVELFRVYQPVNGNGNHLVDGAAPEVGHSVDGKVDVGLPQDTASYQVEVKLLRELLGAKDDVISTQAATIEVLTAENSRLTAVITQLTPHKAKAGWWQRLLGGGL
jgi:hypothetical protein